MSGAWRRTGLGALRSYYYPLDTSRNDPTYFQQGDQMTFISIPRKDLEQPLVEPCEDVPARISAVTQRTSAAKNQVLNIVWILSGTEPPAGERVLDSITLVQEAYWKLNLLFNAIGYSPEETGFNTQDLIGREALITVVQEDGADGVRRNKVSRYKKM